jgi:glycosyltransferase involved in cell wall biosynthesis
VSEPPVLLLGAGPAASRSADTLRGAGHDVELVVVGPGVAGLVRAAWRATRACRRGRPRVIVTASPPFAAHLLGRILRRRRRWVAQVDTAPAVRPNRWSRVFDPRPRALRRADVVAAPKGVAQQLQATAGVTPVPSASLPAVSVAPPGRGSRATILMLGTLNTPHVEHLAVAMRERGHRVVVGGDVVPSYAPSALPEAGIDARPLELPALAWVRRLYREVRPDVVHAHWLPAYGFLAAVAGLRPLGVMAWGSDVYGATPRETRKARFAIRRASVAMTDSADLVARLIRLGADPARTHELNWGVDLDRFTPAHERAPIRRRLGFADAPLVLSPRALTPLYNPAVIADGFERAAVPGAQLVFKHIGSGTPDIGRPLPAGATIAGHVPYDELADYYRAADVCISIPDSDSSPRSVWEAMACGCACVVSDLPWAHELIEDGRHALIVGAEPDAVGGAIRRLLGDPGLATRLGGEARSLVERHRDQRVEMDRLSELYESVARTRR